MRIRYSPRATTDLSAIHQHLLERSPAGSRNVLLAIYAAVEFIKRHPQAAETTTMPDVRVKIVQRYQFKIFYRIAAIDLVEIVHVRHTSREPWTSDGD